MIVCSRGLPAPVANGLNLTRGVCPALPWLPRYYCWFLGCDCAAGRTSRARFVQAALIHTFHHQKKKPRMALRAAPCTNHQAALPCSSNTAAWQHLRGTLRPGSRHACRASASAAGEGGGGGKLPVVEGIPLPPPATGSQYAWRRSWGGSGASSGSGGGGGSGRSWQARTRDWGRGPNSSILFVILYRMRLLLLYGVWVTVLYGAFRAVVDLTTAAGKAGYSLVNKAADMLYGSSSDDSSAGTAAAASASVLECSAGSPAAGSVEADGSAAAASEAEGGLPDGEQAVSAASSSSSGSGGRNFPAGHLKDRPAAPSAFENMVSAVIPVYLMLLGSVVFFASV